MKLTIGVSRRRQTSIRAMVRGFHALGAVDHHQGAVDRRQGAVGVFGEVFVTGGVQQVDDGSL